MDSLLFSWREKVVSLESDSGIGSEIEGLECLFLAEALHKYGVAYCIQLQKQ